MLLDHFFVLTRAGAPEGDLLVTLGLAEGSSNYHPGQGTANRRFFFANSALELLYLRDSQEARTGPGRRLHLAERLASDDASPFGLIMKRGATTSRQPFPGWPYQPAYFEPGVSFLVADNSDRLDEPLCILMPDNPPAGSRQPPPQPPFSEVTQLRLHLPARKPSATIREVEKVERIETQTGSPHLLDIEFGYRAEGLERDLRPSLPLRLFW